MDELDPINLDLSQFRLKDKKIIQMGLSKDAQAMLLLTAAFGKERSGDVNPLTLAKWETVRKWLEQNDLRPQAFLEDEAAVLSEWVDQKKGPSSDDIQRLLERGMVYATTLEQWEREGVWVITYLDDDYPTRLNQRLQYKAPPVLFGIGDKLLLNNGGLAVVGSRKAPFEDLEYTRELGQAAADERITVVSGGARGVDNEAMLSALEGGGNAVGILSDNLLRRSMDRSNRDYLLEGQLTLVSVTDPEVKLSRYEFISAAMQRNDYIYCMSDAVVVVHSSDRGGTWSGAAKNLKKDWVPLWMRDTDTMRSVNDALKRKKGIKEGGKFLPKSQNAQAHVRRVFGINDERTTQAVPLSASRPNIVSASPGITDERTRAVLLLTTRLQSDVSDEMSPLGFREWGQFAKWLLDKDLTPEGLFDNSLDKILRGCGQKQISVDRIKTLLEPSRKKRLAEDEESWRKAGIWVLSRADKDYPKALKRKLGYDCPAILFGSGDRALLNQDKKIAVVGSSRGAVGIDLSYSRSFAVAVAQGESVLVSVNRAKIEKDAIETSLANGGQCIAVLTGNLQKDSSKARNRKFMKDKKLISLSALPPHAALAKLTSSAFKQHSAIAYCLSDAAVIVRSGKNDVVVHCAAKCLQSNWASIWVREPEGEISGNTVIIKEGRQWLPKGEDASDHVHRMLNPDGFASEQIYEGLQSSSQRSLFQENEHLRFA